MKINISYLRSFLTCVILIFGSVCSYADHYPYLNDVDINHSNTSPMNNHDFPRIINSEVKAYTGNMERYTKYNILTSQTVHKRRISEIQSLNPAVMYFWHISPRAYQNFQYDTYCTIGNAMAFESSGPTTQGGPISRGCSIYAGHWLYKAGTTLAQPIDVTQKTLKWSISPASKSVSIL